MTEAIVKADQQIGALAAAPVGASYCSINIDSEDRATAAKVYNALNNPEGRISDMINKDIAVKDVLIEITEVVNAETGATEQAPRVVLIDEKGKAYQSVSVGMYGAVRNLVKIYGEPTWEPPITCTVIQKKTGKGSMLTLLAKS